MDMYEQSLQAVTDNFMADRTTRDRLLAAERGDPVAQYLIGCDYKGHAWYDDVSLEAVKWLELAAQQGHVEAQYELACSSYEPVFSGDLPPLQDDPEATFRWALRAAQNGHVDAMGLMGTIYEQGIPGVSKDPQEAANWYLREAKSGGYARSLIELLKKRACWISTEDEALLIELLRKKAEEKVCDCFAKANLATSYTNGLFWLAPDDREAVKWHSLNVADIEELLFCPFEQKDIDLFERNAEHCGIRLQRLLGTLFESGDYRFHSGEHAECNPRTAAGWYERAATRGDAEAQLSIARMYDEGRGVPQNAELAAQWYKKAAQQGLADAQYALGMMYDNGRGLTLSYRLARKWFRSAAENGDTNASYQLGLNYLFGKGVRENRKRAEKLFRDASTGDHVLGSVALAVVTGDSNDLSQAVELLSEQDEQDSLGSMEDQSSRLEEFRRRLADIVERNPIMEGSPIWLEPDLDVSGNSPRIWCRNLSATARFATVLRGMLFLVDDEPDEIEARACLELATWNDDPVARYFLVHLDRRNRIADMSPKKYAAFSNYERDDKPTPDYRTGFRNSMESRLSELWRNIRESQVKEQEGEKLRQAEIKAAEDEQKRTLSFLTHTLNNTLSTGPETVRTVLDILGSDLYDQGQVQYKAINNMASLFPVFLFVESLLKTFKLYVSDPERLREKWDSDRSGDASIAFVIAMALRQSVARFVFSSNHLTQLRRLLPSQDKEAIKNVRKSFVEEMIPLEISVETADKVFDWIKVHFCMLQVEIDADAEMHFSSNATRHMFFFAAFSELIYNALKYSDGTQPIHVKWYLDGSDYRFTCVNSFPVETAARSTQEGANGGLFFIEKLMSMLRESALSYTHECGEYRASLQFDHNNFGVSGA